jgi:hypothetical protein
VVFPTDNMCLTSESHFKAFDGPYQHVETFDAISHSERRVSLFDMDREFATNTELQQHAMPEEPSSMDAISAQSSQAEDYVPRLGTELPFDISQMGSRRFDHLTKLSPVLLDDKGSQVRMTNSPFSDHISLVEHLIRQEWQTLKFVKDYESKR